MTTRHFAATATYRFRVIDEFDRPSLAQQTPDSSPRSEAIVSSKQVEKLNKTKRSKASRAAARFADKTKLAIEDGEQNK